MLHKTPWKHLWKWFVLAPNCPLADVGGQQKKSIICKCRVLFGPTCWPQTGEPEPCFREGGLATEACPRLLWRVTGEPGSLLTRRWRVGACAPSLSKASGARTLFKPPRTEYASHLCSQTMEKSCLGQPWVCNGAPATVLAYAEHFGNSLWLNKACYKVKHITIFVF